MDEPLKKKAKFLAKSDSSYVFAEENKLPDRILLVGSSRFAVQSDVLVTHSEFFRCLFTSNFAEKDEQQTELKELEADKVKLFLEIVFKPELVQFSSLEEVESMLQMSVYFQAYGYPGYDFLVKKRVFERFPSAKYLILQCARDHQLDELKNDVDTYLAEEFAAKFPVDDQHLKLLAQMAQPHVTVLDSLDLTIEFNLAKLQAKIDTLLAAEYVYFCNRNFSKQSFIHKLETKYYQLLPKYRLEKLSKAVDSYEIHWLSLLYINGTFTLKELEEAYLRTTGLIEMTELKKLCHSRLLIEYEKGKFNGHLNFRIMRVLDICNTCEIDTVKDLIEEDIIAYLKLQKGNFFHHWKIFKHKVFNGQMNWYKMEFLRDKSFLTLLKRVQEAYIYRLEKYKNAIEEFFISEISVFAQKDCTEAVVSCLEFAVYSLPKLKEKLLKILVETFSDFDVLISKPILQTALENCDKQGLQELKAVIIRYLEDAFDKRAERQDYLDEEDFLYLFSKYSLQSLKGQVEQLKIVEFEKEADIAKYANMSQTFGLPALKEVVELHMIQKFHHAADFCYLDMSVSWNMVKYKDAVESYLIEKFKNDHSFINLNMVFKYHFGKLKNTVTDFLKTANMDDMKGRAQHILSLTDEQQLFVLRTMLGESACAKDSEVGSVTIV